MPSLALKFNEDLMKNFVNAVALAALFAAALPSQAATTAEAPLPTLPAHQQKAESPSFKFPPPAGLPQYTILPSGTTATVTFAHGIDNLTLKTNFNSPALMNVANPAELLPPSLRNGVARCTLIAEGSEVNVPKMEIRPTFRAGDLSCFDKTGKLVDKAYLIGYLVGDDGNLGLPEHVIKTGMKATFVVSEDGKVFQFSHQ